MTDTVSTERRVLTRHRLPAPYRAAIVVCWLLPIPLLLLSMIVGVGLTPALLDPRLWLPLLIIALPARHIWREGIDVLNDGLIARLRPLPRYYPFSALGTWYFDARPARRTLTIWDAEGEKVLCLYAAHLTDFPLLMRALRDHVRDRQFPY